MGRNATSKIGVNAVTGRGYNPSVFLHLLGAKIHLPLHMGGEDALSHRGALFRIPHSALFCGTHLNYSLFTITYSLNSLP